MSACRRVIGATDDGKHLVICGQQAPCPDHFPQPRSTITETRYWPTGASPARFLPVVDLLQISDADWQRMARQRADAERAERRAGL